MRISILCTDDSHPVFQRLTEWARLMIDSGHDVDVTTSKNFLKGGDVLFLVSCSQIISEQDKASYERCLVLHASDLPKGRGWSPHIWSILAGESRIIVSLIEADSKLDAGKIWLKKEMVLAGHELLPEINKKLFDIELQLMSQAVEQFSSIVPKPQKGDAGPYFEKRTPQDSKLDIDKSIAEQFNLLRVVDNERYPAFFEMMGQRYIIKIQKDANEQ